MMISRRQQECERVKNTVGYKIWSVGFTILYPVISLFTFSFTMLLSLFSSISQGLVWILKGGKRI